jgi:hypothetical protein
MTDDPVHVPSIAALLTDYRDRTGASYEDMSKAIGGVVSDGRLHQLATKTPSSFPREPSTITGLADLLQVPVTTILNAFAVSLGLTVASSGSMLAISLPPGTDNLTPEDVQAIRGVVRQMVRARQAATPPLDLDEVEGVRLAEHDNSDAGADTQTKR